MLSVKVVGADEIEVALEQRIMRLSDMTIPLTKGTAVVYEATRQRFESRGDGSWPPLAESTVARKESQGMAEPKQPLYAEGNLFESVTSASGPNSIPPTDVTVHAVLIGVDWERDGWQIPMVLSQGTDDAGRGHNTVIPARPIWPPIEEVVEEVTLLIWEWLA